MNNKDEIVFVGRWQFDKTVTEVFDDMLKRSIPELESMRKLVTSIICKFIQPNSEVLDLGCSTGGAIQDALILSQSQNVKFWGVESSKPMCEAAIKRLSSYISNGTVEIMNLDLKTNFPKGEFSVISSILTLQFIPIEFRQEILANIFLNLKKGGVFIFVEKVLGLNHEGNKLLTDLYLQAKSDNGYSSTQIESKKKSLEGILVPLTGKQNEDFLKEAGFQKIQQFWQNLNFVGWVAFK